MPRCWRSVGTLGSRRDAASGGLSWKKALLAIGLMYGLTDESGRQTNRCGQTADLAGLRRILERFGNRSYRAVQLEAGVLGGKLYLGLDLWWRVELWLPGLRLATFQSKARVH